MIKVGIIGNAKKEREIYQTLHSSKQVESVGFYSPGRDFTASSFKNFHNPIELIESSDAIFIEDSAGVSIEFLKLVIRKSKHLFFRCIPTLKITELKEILNLNKEAQNIIHFYNPFLLVNPNLGKQLDKGAKIINFQFSSSLQKSNIYIDVFNAIIFLNKVENSGIKHSDVFGLIRNDNIASTNIRNTYSDGSIHNIVITNEKINSSVHIFQKNQFIEINLYEENKPTPVNSDIPTFNSFIDAINNKNTYNISFEDFFNAFKIYQDIREKLNYSGIENSN